MAIKEGSGALPTIWSAASEMCRVRYDVGYDRAPAWPCLSVKWTTLPTTLDYVCTSGVDYKIFIFQAHSGPAPLTVRR